MATGGSKRIFQCGECKEDLTAAVERACEEGPSNTSFVYIIAPHRARTTTKRERTTVWVECSKGHTTGYTCGEPETDGGD